MKKMELKRLCLCLAVLVLAYVSQCSEARHSLVRRDADDLNYDDLQNDEGTDDEAQNDGEGNEEEGNAVEAVILTPSSHYNGTVGGSVRLGCKVSPASESIVVQWTRNNLNYFLGTQKSHEQKTYAGERFSIAANSTDLVVKNVQPNDSGIYTCEILQVNRPKIQHNLVVYETSRVVNFTATNKGQVTEGSDLVLTCDVLGSPPPKIVWSRDDDSGNTLLHEKDATFSGNTITIRNVTRSHSGRYYCYAFNGIGNHQAEINVVVRGRPHVEIQRTKINSDIGVEAILQCSVHNHLAHHIRWYKDGQRIEDSSNSYIISTEGQTSNLTVIPRVDNDFGTFTCEAENDLGSHNSSVDLVQSPVLDHLQIEGPKISWTIHSHQPVEQIEVQLMDLINGDGEWKTISVPVPEAKNAHEYEVIYSLENELNSGKYEVTVKVKNNKSWSDHTEPKILEYEERPHPIQHASVYRANAHSTGSTPIVISTALMYLLVRM